MNKNQSESDKQELASVKEVDETAGNASLKSDIPSIIIASASNQESKRNSINDNKADSSVKPSDNLKPSKPDSILRYSDSSFNSKVAPINQNTEKVQDEILKNESEKVARLSKTESIKKLEPKTKSIESLKADPKNILIENAIKAKLEESLSSDGSIDYSKLDLAKIRDLPITNVIELEWVQELADLLKIRDLPITNVIELEKIQDLDFPITRFNRISSIRNSLSDQSEHELKPMIRIPQKDEKLISDLKNELVRKSRVEQPVRENDKSSSQLGNGKIQTPAGVLADAVLSKKERRPLTNYSDSSFDETANNGPNKKTNQPKVLPKKLKTQLSSSDSDSYSKPTNVPVESLLIKNKMPNNNNSLYSIDEQKINKSTKRDEIKQKPSIPRKEPMQTSSNIETKTAAGKKSDQKSNKQIYDDDSSFDESPNVPSNVLVDSVSRKPNAKSEIKFQQNYDLDSSFDESSIDFPRNSTEANVKSAKNDSKNDLPVYTPTRDTILTKDSPVKRELPKKQKLELNKNSSLLNEKPESAGIENKNNQMPSTILVDSIKNKNDAKANQNYDLGSSFDEADVKSAKNDSKKDNLPTGIATGVIIGSIGSAKPEIAKPAIPKNINRDLLSSEPSTKSNSKQNDSKDQTTSKALASTIVAANPEPTKKEVKLPEKEKTKATDMSKDLPIKKEVAKKQKSELKPNEPSTNNNNNNIQNSDSSFDETSIDSTQKTLKDAKLDSKKDNLPTSVAKEDPILSKDSSIKSELPKSNKNSKTFPNESTRVIESTEIDRSSFEDSLDDSDEDRFRCNKPTLPATLEKKLTSSDDSFNDSPKASKLSGSDSDSSQPKQADKPVKPPHLLVNRKLSKVDEVETPTESKSSPSLKQISEDPIKQDSNINDVLVPIMIGSISDDYIKQLEKRNMNQDPSKSGSKSELYETPTNRNKSDSKEKLIVKPLTNNQVSSIEDIVNKYKDKSGRAINISVSSFDDSSDETDYLSKIQNSSKAKEPDFLKKNSSDSSEIDLNSPTKSDYSSDELEAQKETKQKKTDDNGFLSLADNILAANRKRQSELIKKDEPAEKEDSNELMDSEENDKLENMLPSLDSYKNTFRSNKPNYRIVSNGDDSFDYYGEPLPELNEFDHTLTRESSMSQTSETPDQAKERLSKMDSVEYSIPTNKPVKLKQKTPAKEENERSLLNQEEMNLNETTKDDYQIKYQLNRDLKPVRVETKDLEKPRDSVYKHELAEIEEFEPKNRFTVFPEEDSARQSASRDEAEKDMNSSGEYDIPTNLSVETKKSVEDEKNKIKLSNTQLANIFMSSILNPDLDSDRKDSDNDDETKLKKEVASKMEELKTKSSESEYEIPSNRELTPKVSKLNEQEKENSTVVLRKKQRDDSLLDNILLNPMTPRKQDMFHEPKEEKKPPRDEDQTKKTLKDADEFIKNIKEKKNQLRGYSSPVSESKENLTGAEDQDKKRPSEEIMALHNKFKSDVPSSKYSSISEDQFKIEVVPEDKKKTKRASLAASTDRVSPSSTKSGPTKSFSSKDEQNASISKLLNKDSTTDNEKKKEKPSRRKQLKKIFKRDKD